MTIQLTFYEMQVNRDSQMFLFLLEHMDRVAHAILTYL